jgi:hypothetical protein
MTTDEKKGLGGWLILVGIGLVIAPLRLLYTYVPLYQPIFTDGTWEALTTAGSQAYDPLWQPLLTGEIAFNISMLVASLGLLYLFFTKHHRFPLVYIAISAISIIFIPLDAWACSFVLPNEPILDPQTTKDFARALIAGLIWIPYMLLSERVKATFVQGVPLETAVAEESTQAG